MGALIDLTGKQYGRWTVIGRAPNRGKHTYWACRCSCGNVKDVHTDSLKRNMSKSCGCLSIEMAKAQRGRKNPAWKGNNVGYGGLHWWVQRFKPTACERCGKVTTRLDAHNISRTYQRDRKDFIFLCVKCHTAEHDKIQKLNAGRLQKAA